MKALEALAISNVGNAAIEIKVHELFPKFIKQQIDLIRREAKKGYKTCTLEDERLWSSVDEIAPDTLVVKLSELERREMKKLMSKDLAALGYKIEEKEIYSKEINTRTTYAKVSWAVETKEDIKAFREAKGRLPNHLKTGDLEPLISALKSGTKPKK